MSEDVILTIKGVIVAGIIIPFVGPIAGTIIAIIAVVLMA